MTTATAKAPAADAATTTREISPAVKALADLMVSSFTVDEKAVSKEGAIKIEVPKDFIKDNLPAYVTADEIKRVQQHRGEVVAAAALASHMIGSKIMKKNKEVKRAEVGMKIGNDKLDMTYDRERKFGDGKGGDVYKQGHVTPFYTASGATNAGEFKTVRQHIGAEALGLFGSSAPAAK